MVYTIKEFADPAGVTTRTLRYYDKIGLLDALETPHRPASQSKKTEQTVLENQIKEIILRSGRGSKARKKDKGCLQKKTISVGISCSEQTSILRFVY